MGLALREHDDYRNNYSIVFNVAFSNLDFNHAVVEVIVHITSKLLKQLRKEAKSGNRFGCGIVLALLDTLEYERNMREITYLMSYDPPARTKAGRRLIKLAKQAERYEKRNFTPEGK
jgi:hypothetical protein